MKVPKIATVDANASKYIRLKYSNNGYCKCVTCGAIKHWKDIDCGHFIKRDHLLTRFMETNMAPQCRKCNRYMGGREARFAQFIINVYGLSEFEKLMNLEKIVFTRSQSLFLVEENEKYKSLLKDLKNKSS